MQCTSKSNKRSKLRLAHIFCYHRWTDCNGITQADEQDRVGLDQSYASTGYGSLNNYTLNNCNIIKKVVGKVILLWFKKKKLLRSHFHLLFFMKIGFFSHLFQATIFSNFSHSHIKGKRTSIWLCPIPREITQAEGAHPSHDPTLQYVHTTQLKARCSLLPDFLF